MLWFVFVSFAFSLAGCGYALHALTSMPAALWCCSLTLVATRRSGGLMGRAFGHIFMSLHISRIW